MEKLKLSDLNILDIGNTITISGIILSDSNKDYLCYLPEEKRSDNLIELEMNGADWDKFFQQTDHLEIEVLAKAKDGTLTKIILRKSQRQIDAGVTWKVYERDNYTCRYCGAKGIPMTMDHVALWEAGGPSIEANLVTACRKCNKLRGNMEYKDWLNSKMYKERSANLSRAAIFANLELVTTLDKIPLKYHIQKR